MILEHLTQNELTEGQVIENVVVFHHPCPDGWMSAVIARKFLGAGTTIYEGRNYDKPYDEKMLPVYEGKNVYILDFSMPVMDLKAIADVAKKVVVCDHHKSFAEKLGVTQNLDTHPNFQNTEGNLEINFFSLMCGAQITWEYFTDGLRNWNGGEPFPELVNYIGDRDLWTWKLPRSREISAALHCEERTWANWFPLLNSFDDIGFREQYADQGAAILKAQQIEVEKLAQRAHRRPKSVFTPIPVEKDDVKWEGEIACTNSPSLQSEICEHMLKIYPECSFVAAYFDKDATTRIWSLRSRNGTDVDVSFIAKAFPGGGGHKHAAGFTQTMEPLHPCHGRYPLSK